MLLSEKFTCSNIAADFRTEPSGNMLIYRNILLFRIMGANFAFISLEHEISLEHGSGTFGKYLQ